MHRLLAEPLLRVENFSKPDAAGCKLGNSGRRALYGDFESRLRSPLRDDLDRRAAALASLLRDRAVVG